MVSAIPQSINVYWSIFISRPAEDRMLSWPGWLVTYRDDLPVRRRSPFRVLTGPNVLRWCAQRCYCYAKTRLLSHVAIFKVLLERPQSRRTDHFSNIVADREFSTGCYLFTVSNAGLLFILSVCRSRPASHAHFRHRQPCGFNNSNMTIGTQLSPILSGLAYEI